MRLQRLTTTLLATLTVSIYSDKPVNSEPVREVISVRAKKYIPRVVWEGLDTYDNPIKLNQQEQYILQFNDKFGNPLSGFLPVTKEFYYETWIGRQLTRTGDRYYLCRPSFDRCDSFIR